MGVLPGEEVDEGPLRLRGRPGIRVVSDRGDAGRLRVEALGVGADDRLAEAAVAALVDAAEAVDQRVVADVIPAVAVAVEAADPEHDPLRLRAAVLVGGHRVMYDGGLDLSLGRGAAVLAAAIVALGAPLGAGDDIGPRRVRGGITDDRARRGDEGTVDRAANVRHCRARGVSRPRDVDVVERAARAPSARPQLQLVGAPGVDRVAVRGLDPGAPLAAGGAGAKLERPALVRDSDEVEALRCRDRCRAVADRPLSRVSRVRPGNCPLAGSDWR